MILDYCENLPQLCIKNKDINLAILKIAFGLDQLNWRIVPPLIQNISGNSIIKVVTYLNNE